MWTEEASDPTADGAGQFMVQDLVNQRDCEDHGGDIDEVDEEKPQVAAPMFHSVGSRSGVGQEAEDAEEQQFVWPPPEPPCLLFCFSCLLTASINLS